MKSTLAAILLSITVVSGFAQETAVPDSTAKKRKSAKFEISLGDRDVMSKTDSLEDKRSGFPKFSFGLTFSRFDLGFSRYLDQGNFNLSPANENLEFQGGKTSNVGFDFLQTGVRFSSNFKIYLAAGLDWNHIRLKRNVTFQQDRPVLTAVADNVDFEKNRFSVRYLRVPMNFEFRTNQNKKGDRAHIVIGPEVGFLLNGKVKQISDERGKEKFKDDYNFNQFRYGATARIGYSGFGIYAKYYFNDVFADNQGPVDFKNLNFGVMFGF